MRVDPKDLRAAVRAIHPGALALADAEAVMEIAQLLVDADGRNDPDEIALFFEIGKAVYELTGMAELPTPTFAQSDDDMERLSALSKQLSTRASGELAYAVAYALAVSNTGEAPEEGELVANLRASLAIDLSRVPVLARTVEKHLFLSR